MLAQADHNNMGSLSEQNERNKMADSMVHFQRSDKLKFQKISGGAAPAPPKNCFAPPAQETLDTCALSLIHI